MGFSISDITGGISDFFKDVGRGISDAAKSVGKFITKNPILTAVGTSILIPGGGIFGGAKDVFGGLLKNDAIKGLATSALTTAATNAISGKPKTREDGRNQYLNEMQQIAPGFFNRQEEYSGLQDMIEKQFEEGGVESPGAWQPAQLNPQQPTDAFQPVTPGSPDQTPVPVIGTNSPPVRPPLTPSLDKKRARALAIRNSRRFL